MTRLATFAAVFLASGWLTAAAGRGQQAQERPSEITVYKSPTCGCCAAWVGYLRVQGFKVQERNVDDLAAVKARLGVPQAAEACHTAVVEGYVVEGHVPVDAIRRMLKDRPDIVGIAVPGMPSGSPGMEGPKEPYNVVSFDKSGKITVIEKR